MKNIVESFDEFIENKRINESFNERSDILKGQERYVKATLSKFFGGRVSLREESDQIVWGTFYAQVDNLKSLGNVGTVLEALGFTQFGLTGEADWDGEDEIIEFTWEAFADMDGDSIEGSYINIPGLMQYNIKSKKWK